VAEQHDAEEARFQEERRQHLVAEQGAGDVADPLHVARPVGAELEAHRDAADDAEREAECEDLGPQAIGVEPAGVARGQPADAKEEEDPAQADGDRREQDVERDVGGELHSRHQQGIHRFSPPRRANRASSTLSPSFLRSAHGAGGDNRPMIRYVVDVGATNRHTFSVELRIEHPDSAQRLSLPAWIPGSYLVREFARHLSALTPERGGAALPLEQLDKATWLARAGAGVPLVVRYQVYA